MAITTAQIRGARGLLDWSQAELSRRTGISTTSIGNIESGNTQARDSTLQLIRTAFERSGVDFVGLEGVRLQSDFIQTYRGAEGFKEFMEHLYETAKTQGGEIILFNAHPAHWYRWLGEEWFRMHSKRMQELGNRIHFKITSRAGEQLFMSKDFAEYRWLPEDVFNMRALYAYGSNIAFVNFEENDVSVIVLKQAEFSSAFRTLFDVTWDKVAIPALEAGKKAS